MCRGLRVDVAQSYAPIILVKDLSRLLQVHDPLEQCLLGIHELKLSAQERVPQPPIEDGSVRNAGRSVTSATSSWVSAHPLRRHEAHLSVGNRGGVRTSLSSATRSVISRGSFLFTAAL